MRQTGKAVAAFVQTVFAESAATPPTSTERSPHTSRRTSKGSDIRLEYASGQLLCLVYWIGQVRLRSVLGEAATSQKTPRAGAPDPPQLANVGDRQRKKTLPILSGSVSALAHVLTLEASTLDLRRVFLARIRNCGRRVACWERIRQRFVVCLFPSSVLFACCVAFHLWALFRIAAGAYLLALIGCDLRTARFLLFSLVCHKLLFCNATHRMPYDCAIHFAFVSKELDANRGEVSRVDG